MIAQKEIVPVYLYSYAIMFAGLSLAFITETNFHWIKPIVGILTLIGSAIAFFTAISRHKRRVEFVYHEIHALSFLIFGNSLLFLCDNMKDLSLIISYLLFIYAFSEIVFCNLLYNLGQRAVIRTVGIRLTIAIIVGVGAVAAISFRESSFLIFAFLLVLIGVNVIFYVPILKYGPSRRLNITKTPS